LNNKNAFEQILFVLSDYDLNKEVVRSFREVTQAL